MSLIMYDQYMMYSPSFIVWKNCPFRLEYNMETGTSFLFYDGDEYCVLNDSYDDFCAFSTNGIEALRKNRNYNNIYQL